LQRNGLRSGGRGELKGIDQFLLGFGDAFHLILRISLNLKGELNRKNTLFGLGNLISSITMTVFYNILIKMCDSLEYYGEAYNLWIERSILVLTNTV